MIFTILLSLLFAQNKCHTGSVENLALVNTFNEKIFQQEDESIKAFIRSQSKTPLPHHIRRACVAASMKRLEHIRSVKRKVCEDANDGGDVYYFNALEDHINVPFGATGLDKPLCISPLMVSYTTWVNNEALSCIKSLPSIQLKGISLDATAFFQMINNESAFGFHLYGVNGIGMGQLTTSGLSDYDNPYRYMYLVDEIRSSTEESCKSFHQSLEDDLLYTNQGYIRHCQFMSPGEGMARNAIYTALLFATKRLDVIRIFKDYNFPTWDSEKITLLTKVAYSRHGIPPIIDLIQSGRIRASTSASETYDILKVETPYIHEIARKNKEFVSYYNRNNVKPMTVNDLQNNACLNKP